MCTTLTKRERAALRSLWKLPLRVKDGNIELKKGECWGILCSTVEGKVNAEIILGHATSTE